MGCNGIADTAHLCYTYNKKHDFIRKGGSMHMKKIFLSVFCLLFLISALCACSDVSEASISSNAGNENGGTLSTANVLNTYYNYETDCQFGVTNPPGCQNVVKCGKGYYILDENGILYVTDITSGTAIPLCNKPNCLHEPYDYECYANIWAVDGTITYNNGYIYYTFPADVNSTGGGTELYRLKTDGSGSSELVFQSEKPTYKWIIHRDYLYRAYQEYISDNIENADKCRLYIEKISLKNISETKVIYDSEEYLPYASFQYLAAFDEYLYYSTIYENDGEDAGHTYCYLIEDEKTTELLQPDGKSGDLRVHPIADKLVFRAQYGKSVYQCDLNSENVEEIAVLKDKNIYFYTDGTYIYEDNYFIFHADEVGISGPNADSRIVEVYDKDYNLVDTLNFVYDSFSPSICDDQFFINIYRDQESKEVSITYFDKSELGNLNGASWNEKELEILS